MVLAKRGKGEGDALLLVWVPLHTKHLCVFVCACVCAYVCVRVCAIVCCMVKKQKKEYAFKHIPGSRYQQIKINPDHVYLTH